MLTIESVLKVINSTPSYAKNALETLYHGKTFAAVRFNGHIDTFKKTRKGAEGYINKKQSYSYYDEMTFEMKTCGSDLEVFQINVDDIIDPISNVQIWYDYLKDTRYETWTFENALHSAKWMKCDDNVIEYLEKATEEMKESNGFTIIDEYEHVEIIEEVEQKEIKSTIEVKSTNENESITLTIEINEELNGIELYFSSKPIQSVIDQLKEYDFRWHRKGYWYAKQTPERLMIAESLQSIYMDIAANPEELEQINNEIESSVNVELLDVAKNDQILINDSNLIGRKIFGQWGMGSGWDNGIIVGETIYNEIIIQWEDRHQEYFELKNLVYVHENTNMNVVGVYLLPLEVETVSNEVIEETTQVNTFVDTDDKQQEPINPIKNNVIDFSSRFQQKQQQKETEEMTSHFINNVLPYMEQNEVNELQQAYKSNDENKLNQIWQRLMLSTAVKRAKNEILNHN
jgi:hypothetical protein